MAQFALHPDLPAVELGQSLADGIEFLRARIRKPQTVAVAVRLSVAAGSQMRIFPSSRQRRNFRPSRW